MSNLDSRLILGFGKHASVTDFSSTPGSVLHLVPEKQGFYSPDSTRLRRAPYHPTNAGYAPLRGPLDLSKAIALEQLIHGLSGNTGGAIDPELTTDCASILDVAFGTDSVDPAGAVTTATGGTPASKLLGVTEMARFPVGSVVMFQAPLGTFIVRQVRARAGASGAGNLTLDRVWTGAVAAGQNVIRAARWKRDPGVFEVVHGYFRAEYDDDRRDYFGGMCSAQLDFTVGSIARLITSWMFTNVTDVAEANPSFVEPTRGNGLVNVNNTFWIGDTAYYATDMKADLGGSNVPRRANSGPQGIQGYTQQQGAGNARPKLSLILHRGTSTGEIADSTGTPSMNTLQGYDKNFGDAFGTLDVAFQVGGAAAGFGYGVMPAAAVTRAEEVVVDGYKRISVDLEAMAPSDSNLAPFEFHLG